ncbi:RNA polymerase sigma-70 factor [Puteibacter caeruleilacunae]|nr:RNA polymerase sigma-70 factor [Puteibacter caeruleilacunae]
MLEKNLLKRISEGDELAFELLYRRYYARLCAFANKFLFDHAAAEEVVQDVFFNIWEGRALLDDEQALKSYLFRSVQNRSLNVIASNKVKDKYADVIKDIYWNSDEFDAHDSLLAKELNEKFLEAINSLPEQCRKIFLMSRNEGKKYKEIAEELNVSVKTVETQMNRALKRLKTDLAEYLSVALITAFSQL